MSHLFNVASLHCIYSVWNFIYEHTPCFEHKVPRLMRLNTFIARRDITARNMIDSECQRRNVAASRLVPDSLYQKTDVWTEPHGPDVLCCFVFTGAESTH